MAAKPIPSFWRRKLKIKLPCQSVLSEKEPPKSFVSLPKQAIPMSLSKAGNENEHFRQVSRKCRFSCPKQGHHRYSYIISRYSCRRGVGEWRCSHSSSGGGIDHRVPGFLSSRPYWAPPPPQASVAPPPFGSKGRDTLAGWGGGGGIQFRRRDKHSGTLCIL